jgi:hypothetical protein
MKNLELCEINKSKILKAVEKCESGKVIWLCRGSNGLSIKKRLASARMPKTAFSRIYGNNVRYEWDTISFAIKMDDFFGGPGKTIQTV